MTGQNAARARRKAKRIIETIRAEPARLVTDFGGSEMWVRGKVGFVIPTIPEDASPALKDAIARRRSALIDGQCSCGARLDLTRGVVEHESDCPATDSNLDRLRAERRSP